MGYSLRVIRTSLVSIVAATTCASLIACTKNKESSGSTVITDKTDNPQNASTTMRYTLNEGNLTIYNSEGQSVGQASNVTRVLGQPTENFMAYESRSPRMGLVKTIFHRSKANVAQCEKNCRITLRKNFASFKIKSRKKNMAVGLIDKNGQSYNYASAVRRNGEIRPVKLQIGDDFALLTRPNGEKALISSEQGIISNARNVRVQGRFAVATVGNNSYLFNSNNSFQLNNQNDRLSGVLIRGHFAVIDYGVYKRVYHATKGLIVNSCDNCNAYSSDRTPRGLRVGNLNILVSDNFILIPSNSNNGQSTIYSKDNRALTASLNPGTRVKINNFFAAYSGQSRSQLFHVGQGSIMDTGYRARIQLLENGARFRTPVEVITFDNNGRRVQRNNGF